MGEEIEPLTERMINLNRVIEEYKKKYLLNQFIVDGVNIPETISELKKIDPVEAEERVMQWRVYAQAISTRKQELKAKLIWVEANWDKYMGIQQQYINREYGFSVKDRYMIILENDEYAKKLYKLKTDIRIEIELLENVTTNVNYLAESGQLIAKHNMWRERNVDNRD